MEDIIEIVDDNPSMRTFVAREKITSVRAEDNVIENKFSIYVFCGEDNKYFVFSDKIRRDCYLKSLTGGVSMQG